MRRNIITIDEEKCDGCGLCIPGCPEGALEIVGGKARLMSDFYCDGLGACIGVCPQNAIRIEEREAEPYDEHKVMESMMKQGKGVVRERLREHNETENLGIAQGYLEGKGIEVPRGLQRGHVPCGCPGVAMMDFSSTEDPQSTMDQPSQLRQWPVQLHLVSPVAPYFQGRDVILAADCVAYALASFHSRYLAGKSLAIACPKLDDGQEIYTDKITALIDNAGINTLTVMTMEVPCCTGLLYLAREAASQASRTVPLESVVVGIKGNILEGSA